MRVAIFLLFLPFLFAGCLGAEADGSGGLLGGGHEPAHREPWVVLDRDFATTNVGSKGEFPFLLDQEASQLQVVIEYRSSAFSGFRFTAPEPCVAASPGSALYSNSGQSAGTCGALEEGSHALAWTLEAGSVNGHVTIVAMP